MLHSTWGCALPHTHGARTSRHHYYSDHCLYSSQHSCQQAEPLLHPALGAPAAALTYSRGDSERWRRQLEAEAALVFADMPPGPGSTRASLTESFGRGSYRPFTANMDIDSASMLRSSQGCYGGGREPLYGITPTSYASPLRRRGSGISTPLSRSSGVLEGVNPADAETEALLEQVPPHTAGGEETA
jgi:hypothetical protein